MRATTSISHRVASDSSALGDVMADERSDANVEEGRKKREEDTDKKSAAYAARGDEAWAKKDVEGAIRLYGRALRHRASAKLLLRRARANCRRKQFQEVEQDCHKALVLERSCPEAMVLLAKAKRQAGRIEEAYQVITEATKKHPENLEMKKESRMVNKAIEERDRKERLMQEAKAGKRAELSQVLEACETMAKIRNSSSDAKENSLTQKNCIKRIEESVRDCEDAQDLLRYLGGIELLTSSLPVDNLAVLQALLQACRKNAATSRVIAKDSHFSPIVPLVSDRRTSVVQLVLKILEEVAPLGALCLGRTLRDAGQLRTICLIGQKAPDILHTSSLSVLAEIVKLEAAIADDMVPFADALIGAAIRGACSSSKSVLKDALTILHFCSHAAQFKTLVSAEYAVPGSSKKSGLDILLGLVESISEEAPELEIEIVSSGVEVAKRDFSEVGVDQIHLLILAVQSVGHLLAANPVKVSQLKNIGTVAMLLPLLSHSPPELSAALANLLVTCCKQDIEFAYLIGDLGGSSAVYNLCIAEYSHHSAAYFSLLSYLALSKNFQEHMTNTKNAESLARLLSVRMKDDSTAALADALVKICRYDTDFYQWMCCEHSVIDTLVQLWYSHAGGTKKVLQALLSLLLENEASSNTLSEQFEEGQLLRLLHDLRAFNMAEQMKATGGASSQVSGMLGGYQLSQKEQDVDEASRKINLSKLGAYVRTLSSKDQLEDFVLAEYACSTAVLGRNLVAWFPDSYTYLLMRESTLVPIVEQQIFSGHASRVRAMECNLEEHGFGNVPSCIDVLVCIQVWSMLSTFEKENFFSSIASKLHNDGKVIIIEDDINTVGQMSEYANTAGFAEYAEPEISVEHFTKVFFLP